MLRFHLKPFLERHRISAYQLVQATKGKLSESTVYGMSRKPLQRIDLDSVRVILGALSDLTTQPVQMQDLLEDRQEIEAQINPKYAELLKNAKPATKAALQNTISPATPDELENDQMFWSRYRRDQLELQESTNR